MKMVEIKNSNKSGIIPFYVDETGQILMLFMIPSDPYYGGPRLQIAKGGIDPGETSQDTAVREGIEELGLRMSNVVAVERGTPAIELKRADGECYSMEVFVAQIVDPGDFDTPHYETGSTDWLTIQEFRAKGRAFNVIWLKNLTLLCSESPRPMDGARFPKPGFVGSNPSLGAIFDCTKYKPEFWGNKYCRARLN